jgi:aspartyl-tRNA(Asn)/glutamyl-tRNA(Gln) amidotransferase subunit B
MAGGELEAVIGLEIHAQISTKTKMFCRCDNDSWEKAPNVNVCPVCMGFPGQLPVLNEEALRKGIIAALALNCEIKEFSKFDRKNYFYPDSPKGFQISQFDQPVSEGGELEIDVDGKKKKVRITRLHLEDDAGKLTHVRDGSLVDFNRSGTPLMEIVSDPDIRSSEEASAYARLVQQILRYVGSSEADMEKGMMRFDASVSIREKGSKKLNNRSEIKNLNSFRALERAIDVEIDRQKDLWADGKAQTEDLTVGWNDDKGEIFIMRTKEGSSDYRYFPEPDVPPVILKKKDVDALRSEIPELPFVRRERFVADYGLIDDDARILTSDRDLADYYEKVVEICGDAKLANSFVTTILMKHLKEELIGVSDQKVTARMMGELLNLVVDGDISNNVAKAEVFDEMYESGKLASEIVKKKGLKQISDTGELEKVCKKAIEANPQAVEDFKNGKDRAIGAIVGMVMKETKGQANPGVVDGIVRKML